MKKAILGIIAIAFSFSLFALLIPQQADAATRVRGYYRKSGTYTQPHYRSSPNRSRWDNYSTRGNINPYSGKRGYTSPYKSWGY